MKKCVQCGKTYNDEQNFCTACGSSLEAAAPTTPAGTEDNQGKSPIVSLLVKNWALIAAIIGYALSWAEGYCIHGTIIAAGAALVGWFKDETGFACSGTLGRVLASAVGVIAVVELFQYGVIG